MTVYQLVSTCHLTLIYICQQAVVLALLCPGLKGESDLELHILPLNHRISPNQLAEKLNADSNHEQGHLLVDVRSEPEFKMCRIDGAVNCPIDNMCGQRFEQLLEQIRRTNQVIFICRRGNDSQIAAKKVLEAIEDEHRGKILDLSGGLHSWSERVDGDFPIY
ncbi:adenylyltransferase and sulfurtransferase MOCS3-like [Aphomia sociella]